MDFENPKHLIAAGRKVRAEYLKGVHNISISDHQKLICRDDPVKGPLWVSKFTLPSSSSAGDTSCESLLQLVDEANVHQVRYDHPASAPLDFEWVGYRANVKKDTPEPSIGEKEKFDRLSAETKSPLTIFYIYGGTFVVNTPSCYRKTAVTLAQATGAKALLVRQRLAPQNPFPAALLDVFQAYLALLHPPAGSPHEPIPASSIVIAGDSSGACLALGLLQILLQLQRREATVTFHGAKISLSSSSPKVPAGMALAGPAPDLTNSLPSCERNAYCDTLPLPNDKLPYLEKSYPTCPAWPTRPARANLYCEAGMLAHPLVSPAASEDWTGACPVWMALGQEQVADSVRLVAQEIHRAGGSVTLSEYECLFHSFYFVLRTAPQTKHLFGEWAKAIGGFARGERPPSSARFIRARGLKEEPLDVGNLVEFSVPQAREWMWEKTHTYKVPAFHQEGRGPSL